MGDSISKEKCLATGLLIGLLSGLLGVGGGFILVPILSSYFLLPQHKAHAVSLAVVLPTAVIGSFVYAMHGDVEIATSAQLAIGGIIGAAIGVRIMQKIPAATLKKMFGLVLLLIGLRMIIS